MTEAEKQASYTLGVEEIKVRLAKELAEVCREFCDTTWAEALNAAGVPADSELRQPGRIHYHPHIREIPKALSSPPAQVIEPSKQPLTAQVSLPLLEASKESGQIEG